MWTTLRGTRRARLLEDLVDFATVSAGRRYAASLAVQPQPASVQDAPVAKPRSRRTSSKTLLRQQPSTASKGRATFVPSATLPPREHNSAAVIGAAVPHDGSTVLDDDARSEVDAEQIEPSLYKTAWRAEDPRDVVRPPLAPADAQRRGHFGTFAQGYVTASALNTLHHLSVALATGQTARAKSIFHNVEDSLGYVRSSHALSTAGARVHRSDASANVALRDVIPSALHAGFVRRLYADALKAQEEDRSADKRRAEAEAYEWLQNLRYNGRDWGEVDHHVVAAAIKGVLQ